jgi:hypothetical protein
VQFFAMLCAIGVLHLLSTHGKDLGMAVGIFLRCFKGLLSVAEAYKGT